MEMEGKMDLIKLLTELNGVTIINKLEGNENTKNMCMLKKVAKKLENNGIGKFDFTSNDTFEKSVSDFLSDF